MKSRFVLLAVFVLVLASVLGRLLLSPLKDRSASREPAPQAPSPVSLAGSTRVPARTASDAAERVFGIVYDASGFPAPGADVTAMPATLRGDPCGHGLALRSTRTDVQGRFEFAGLSGDIALMARRGPVEYAQAIASSSGPHELRFVPGVEIEGIATDDAGRPVAGVEIVTHLRPEGYPLYSFWPPETTRAESTGAFRAGPFPPGTSAVFEARAPGFLQAKAGPAHLTPGTVPRLAFKLERGLSVTGVVRDTDGRPLGGVAITGQQGDTQTHRTASGSDGAFTLDGLTRKSVRLAAQKNGYAPATAVAPCPTSSITLALAPEMTVTGRVEPVRPDLFAVVTSNGISLMAPVGRDGRFTVDHVGRGPVRLDIQSSDRTPLASTTVDLATQRGDILVQLR